MFFLVIHRVVENLLNAMLTARSSFITSLQTFKVFLNLMPDKSF